MHFSTSTPGPIGTVTLDLKSDGTGIDGLGVTDLGDVTIPVAVTSGQRPRGGRSSRRSPAAGRSPSKGGAYTLDLGDDLGAGHGLARRAQQRGGAGRRSVGQFRDLGRETSSSTRALPLSPASPRVRRTPPPTVTLDTGVAGTFSETITLDPTDAATSAALPVETLTITGTVATATPPPTITAPATAYTCRQATASAVAGVSVADSNAGASLTVTLSDTDGLLSATTNGDGRRRRHQRGRHDEPDHLRNVGASQRRPDDADRHR